MWNYIRALKRQFDTAEIDPELTAAYGQVHETLHRQLKQDQQKLLLQLVDLQDSLLYESTLNSFTAGFKLAWEIQRELSEQPAYSFDQEEERQIKTGR
jgi:hypothetical protein